MTWAEFQIKSFAYTRIEENDLRKVRKIAYYAMVGSHLDPKSLPKGEAAWFKIGNEVRSARVSELQKEIFKNQYAQYLREREAVMNKRAKEAGVRK